MNTLRKIEISFFFLLVGVVATLTFLIFVPYLSSLFVALVFAIVSRPIYDRINRKVKKPGFASFCTLALLFLVIFIPATLFGFFVFSDAQAAYVSSVTSTPLFDRVDSALQPFELYVRHFLPEFKIDVSTYVDDGLAFLVDNFGSVFSKVVGIVFQAFVMLLALFYLFRDGGKFRTYIINLSPLANEYDERILRRLEIAISSVVKGKLLIVVAQGLITALTFWMFGIPHAMLWGAVTSLSALIPAVGVALVFIPAVLYLFLTAGVGLSVFLLGIGVIIGAVDNIVGPMLFEKGLQMHPFLILLSVFGGLVFFGPIGFLVGPVLVSLLLALLDIYLLLFQTSGSAH